ncbi:MAG: DEAD/DEAH box helicase family protein [Candidatus Lindowbacteria bacterium]|nr:DEAD/DEAH box helicase family protein [Candidatus Lindowbacteria bacterium]
MKSVKKIFSPAALETIRAEIEGADGNEVFFIGATDEQRVVTKVMPVARGNEDSVPAITQLARPGDVVIHNHPTGPLTPSSADVAIASNLGQEGVGFYIVNNEVTKVYEVVAAFGHEKLEPLDIEKLSQILMPGGPVARKLRKYERREQQIEMMAAVARAFNENSIAAIEAGTGTGKSFAYLIPSIQWAVKNKERVVVSTNTINLQEQLIRKDIPVLLSCLAAKCKAVLVKGRGNYACKRKLAMLEQEFELLAAPDERDVLRSILEWSKQTRDGSLADLNFVPRSEVWEKVNAESDTCLRVRCSQFAACFVNRARREAASADLLVVNHHLLFADLAVRTAAQNYTEMAVLPGYRRIILDEAHNIEDSATSYFGARVTRIGTLRLLGRVYYRPAKKEEGGLITLLRAKLMRIPDVNEHVQEVILDIQNEIIPAKLELEGAVAAAFDAIHEFVFLRAAAEPEAKMRIDQEFRNDERWRNDYLPPVEELLSGLRTFISRLKFILNKLETVEDNLDAENSLIDERVELCALSNRLDVVVTNIEDILYGETSDRVRWVEITGRKRTPIVRLFSAPLNIGPFLAEQVYSKFPTVVLTSATLTVVDRFDFLAGRVGLDLADRDRVGYLALASPFNFAEQAIIGIPTDIPGVKDSKYREALVQSIFRCLTISEGRAFLLFTSFRMLDSVYSELAPRLEEVIKIRALRQGEDNRTALLEKFRRDISSVLFGTLSFWEGVDVEGESLECIVLVKLPFKVPDEPITQARAEDIERRGGNAFNEYSLPLAVIKFKQGFGRLIRNRTDHGAVLILDKRVVEKIYGQTFLNSLPKCRVVRGASDEVFNEFQRFFTSFRRSRRRLTASS